jgi:hypothetical protein
MRELVYLSQAKLAQFLPQKPPWWARLGRSGRLEVSTPVGSVALESGEPVAVAPTSNLEAVIAEVEANAKWFADPEVAPGEWVHFDLPMNYTIVSSLRMESRVLRPIITDGTAGPLLFLDAKSAEAATRLLLHGSRTHLLGHSPPAPEVEVAIERSSSMDRFLAEWLRQAQSDPFSTSQGRIYISRAMRLLVGGLDRQLGNETASWMAGFARVTTLANGIVGATPLYVERVSPP